MTERWFTGLQSGALAVLPIDFTEREKQTMTEIMRFAQDPMNKDRELMHCLDAHGSVLHGVSDGVKGAPITPTMEKVIHAGHGVRLWHNHPSQQSLSDYDWNCASACSQLEILAMNESGSIFVGRIPYWQDGYERVIENFRKIATDLEFKLSRLAKEGKLEIGIEIALTELTGHVLNLAMKASGLVFYAHWLSYSDQMVFDAATRKGVVDPAIAFASGEIQSVLGS